MQNNKYSVIKRFIIGALLALLFYLAFFKGKLAILLIEALVLLVFALIIYFDYKKNTLVSSSKAVGIATKLFLVDGDEEWQLTGKRAFVIGKSEIDGEVDINLINSEYESYVSDKHAVVNYVKGAWYIEDLESKEGLGIKKKQNHALKLKAYTPCRIDKGDILYVSKIKLLVK